MGGWGANASPPQKRAAKSRKSRASTTTISVSVLEYIRRSVTSLVAGAPFGDTEKLINALHETGRNRASSVISTSSTLDPFWISDIYLST